MVASPTPAQEHGDERDRQDEEYYAYYPLTQGWLVSVTTVRRHDSVVGKFKAGLTHEAAPRHQAHLPFTIIQCSPNGIGAGLCVPMSWCAAYETRSDEGYSVIMHEQPIGGASLLMSQAFSEAENTPLMRFDFEAVLRVARQRQDNGVAPKVHFTHGYEQRQNYFGYDRPVVRDNLVFATLLERYFSAQ